MRVGSGFSKGELKMAVPLWFRYFLIALFVSHFAGPVWAQSDDPNADEDEAFETIQIFRSGGAMAYFSVVVSYDIAPEKVPENITISGGGANEIIPLAASDDGTTFSSPLLQLISCSLCRLSVLPRLDEGQPESRKIVAELFAGAWQVTHMTGQGQVGLMGSAVVSDDGKSASLVIRRDGRWERYRSRDLTALRDEENGNHLLDMRFERTENESSSGPEPRPAMIIYVTGDNPEIKITTQERNYTQSLPVYRGPGSGRDGNLRIELRAGTISNLRGFWNNEDWDGDLHSGGRETWTRDPQNAKGPIVHDNQLDAEASAEYRYPFDDNGDPIGVLSRKRTLVVYGQGLPDMADEAAIRSLSEYISLEPDPRSGADRHRIIDEAFARAEVENQDWYDAFIVTAVLESGVTPGRKLMSVGNDVLAWNLVFQNQFALMQFKRNGEAIASDATDVFYPGDVGTVELIFDVPIPYSGLNIQILRGKENSVEETVLRAVRVDDEKYIYRTEQIHFYDADNITQSPPDNDAAYSMPVSAGLTIGARLHDKFEAFAVPKTAYAEFLAHPNGGSEKSLWHEALDKVAACYSIEIDDYKSFQHDPATAVSRVIMSELRSRNVGLTMGDHAAAILLKDEFKAQANDMMPTFLTQRPTYENAVISRAAAAKRGNAANEKFWATSYAVYEDGGWFWFDEEIPLYETLDTFELGRRLNIPEDEAEVWAIEQTVLAGRRQLDRTLESLEEIKKIEDCSLENMLVLSGYKLEPLVAKLIPRLLRAEESHDPLRRYWAPDLTAQAYVRSLYVAGKAVRALDSYSRMDTYAGVAVVAVATGIGAWGLLSAKALGAAATFATVSITTNAFDIALLSRDYVVGEIRLDLAKGLAPVAGMDVYFDAQGRRVNPYVLGATAILGVVFSVPDAMIVSSFRTMARGRALYAARGMGVLANAAELTEPQRIGLAAYFKHLAERVGRAGYGALNSADLDALLAYEALVGSRGLAAADGAVVARSLLDTLDQPVADPLWADFGGQRPSLEELIARAPIDESIRLPVPPGAVRDWMGAKAGILSRGLSAEKIAQLFSDPLLSHADVLLKADFMRANFRALIRQGDPRIVRMLDELMGFERTCPLTTSGGTVIEPRPLNFDPNITPTVPLPSMTDAQIAKEIADALDGITGAGVRTNPIVPSEITGPPAGGRTGVGVQANCDACGLVAGEAVLRDLKIISGERPENLMRAFAANAKMLKVGEGMRIDQLAKYLQAHGIDNQMMRIAQYDPIDMSAAVRAQTEVLAVIQSSAGGYHWVRVEKFIKDGAGNIWVSYGEGGLRKGLSRRKLLSDFDQMTRIRQGEIGAGQRLRSLFVNTRAMSEQALEAARAQAAANMRLGAQLISPN